MKVFDERPSDEQFTQKIDFMCRQLLAPISNSTVFERFQKLVDVNYYVVHYFGWLGDLFTFGILGHCEKVWQCLAPFCLFPFEYVRGVLSRSTTYNPKLSAPSSELSSSA